jgi:hypothetical protein
MRLPGQRRSAGGQHVQPDKADGITLVVGATSDAGTLGVSGGTETDGITLNGTVSAVDIAGDRSFAVTGEFGEPNNVGEAFTLTGACPE